MTCEKQRIRGKTVRVLLVVLADIFDTSTDNEMMDAETNRGTCRETDVARSMTSREDDTKM